MSTTTFQYKDHTFDVRRTADGTVTYRNTAVDFFGWRPVVDVLRDSYVSRHFRRLLYCALCRLGERSLVSVE